MTFAFNSQLQAEGDVCIQTPSMSLESGIVLRPAVPRPMHFLPFPVQKQKGNAKMKCSRFFHTPSSQSDPIKSALETSDGRTRISFYGAIGSCKTECLQQAELPEEDLSDRISLCSSSRTKVCFPPVFFPITLTLLSDFVRYSLFVCLLHITATPHLPSHWPSPEERMNFVR